MLYDFTLFFFLLGLLFGSFYNVVGLRVPKQEFFHQNRSYCFHCGQTLRWFELIPVLSFILQKGRCRHCQNTISYTYPTMELTSGIMFAFCYAYYGVGHELILALLLISLFHIVLVSDLRYMIIPDKVLLFFLPLFVCYRIFFPLEPWWSSLIGGIGAFLVLTLIIVISKGGMGGGDLKLFSLLGIALGWKLVLLTFFLSTLIGAVISGCLLMLGIISRKKPIPFGPFIVISAAIAFFSGRMVIDWYIQTFF